MYNRHFWQLLGLLLLALPCSAERYALQPVSGGDGLYEQATLEGQPVLRSLEEAPGAYSSYIYFQAPVSARSLTGQLFLEVRYLDFGAGPLGVQYNAEGNPYRSANLGQGKLMQNSGEPKTAWFVLDSCAFNASQNNQADLRLTNPDSASPLVILGAWLDTDQPEALRSVLERPWLKPYEGPTRDDVDATTILGKVLCGYQGWFACPGDPLDAGWIHWSRSRARIAPDTLSFDLWPDMTDYPAEERYPAPGFTNPDGSQAYLFSSQNPATVQRHFEWMRDYGLDGVEVQRFVNGLEDPENASSTRVLCYARNAARRTGRVFIVGYDMSGCPEERLFDLITRDWKFLVDQLKLTDDPRYLHQGGKPVLTLWGFYTERFSGGLANKLIDFFKDDPTYGAWLIGGGEWWWRNETDPEWARAFRRFNAYEPWNVGNFALDEAGNKQASTGYWADDMAELARFGVLYRPVLYPGFSWDNLQRAEPGTSYIPRLKGEYFWRQFVEATNLGIQTAFVAMFDEVDEGTAIFKVTDAPPTQAHFATLEGLSSDFYLKLVGLGARLLRGEEAPPPPVPVKD
jgi:hypothetical protein